MNSGKDGTEVPEHRGNVLVDAKKSKFWEFLKDIGPIVVGLAAVLGSIWSGNLDRSERTAVRIQGERKEEYDRRLEVARRMVGACLKIEDDGRELEDVAKQGATAEAEQDETRLSSDIEEFDEAYGESVLLFDSASVKDFKPVEAAAGDIDFPRTENSKNLSDDVKSFSESLHAFIDREQELLPKLKALFQE